MGSIPFPQLQAFLAVARSQSFSGAARDLGVSRSAVSQSVRQLEDELRLVARTTRSVSLTDAGRRLVEAAGPAVAQTRAALAEVSAEPYAATVPGFYLYYPSRAQRSVPLQKLIETVRELTARRLASTKTRPRAQA
ncbi:MAG: LysR family transcriptional regulator [Labilithrix sp.]|nr:LysR family transcriptional regulator [Labilithrix sp.]MCW5816842.1 LysR family transcriptional regulator [Labilithrix sp.]